MSVNITVNIPLSSYLDLKAGRTPDCGPEVLQALLRAIKYSPCEVIKKPLAIEAPPVTKKVTYTKVTRFRKPDDPPVHGVLLSVEGSVDCKKYRVDHWTKMGSLKNALSKTNGIALQDFSLYYQGYKIKDSDTPETVCNHNPAQSIMLT